jgi:hypothetical protein
MAHFNILMYHVWGVLKMYPKLTWVTRITMIQTLSQKVMVPWTYMMMHMLSHIYKHVKS